MAGASRLQNISSRVLAVNVFVGDGNEGKSDTNFINNNFSHHIQQQTDGQKTETLIYTFQMYFFKVQICFKHLIIIPKASSSFSYRSTKNAKDWWWIINAFQRFFSFVLILFEWKIGRFTFCINNERERENTKRASFLGPIF